MGKCSLFSTSTPMSCSQRPHSRWVWREPGYASSDPPQPTLHILGVGLSWEHGNPLSILNWRISWAEEPGWLQSMESQRVGYNLATEQHQQLEVIMIKYSCGHGNDYNHQGDIYRWTKALRSKLQTLTTWMLFTKKNKNCSHSKMPELIFT